MATRPSCPKPKVTAIAVTAAHRAQAIARVVTAPAQVVAGRWVTVRRVLTLAQPQPLARRLPMLQQRHQQDQPDQKAPPSNACAVLRPRLPPVVSPKENNDAATRTSQVPQGTKRP
jgi:hypothetical protein